MFKFKGISSEDMQVVIEEEEHFIARASKRYEITEIEGKDGAIFDELGYSVVERPMYVQCLNINKIDDILAWLDGEGEFEYKGRKTTARFYSQLDPQRSSCIRIMDTTFIRDPFWYKANEDFQLVKDRKDKKASGEYIHVEDSSNCRAKIGIGGNQEQETRSGKNLLELMEGTYSNNGITAVVKDGVITLNGTATAISFVSVNLLKSFNLVTGTTYHLSIFNTETVGDSSNICALRINQEGTKQAPFDKINSNLAIIGNLLFSYVTIRTPAGITYNNFVVKPQFELGAGTSTWEQGGVSPSSDYQSPVKTVGSNVNIFDITKYDYRNLAGASVQINDKTNFRITATMNNNANCAAGFKILDLTKYAGKTLTVKAYAKSSTSTNKTFIALRQNNSVHTGTKSNELFDESQNTTDGIITLKYKVTDTVDDSNRYLFIYFYATRGAICNIGDYVDYKVKLVEGTEVGEYSKYGQGSVKVTKCNKNLFDKSKALTGYWITDEQGNIGQAGATAFVTDFIPVFKDVPVYIPATGTSRREFYNKNKVGIQYLNNSNAQIFTPTEDGFIRVSCNMATITMDNLMIFYGETSTSYEEHQEQSYIMPVQAEMLEGDYFDFDNEEEVHVWNKLVLKGTEEFNSWTGNAPSGYKVFYSKILTNVINSQGDLKCNALKYIENPWESGKNAIGLQRTFKELYISIESKYASTLEEFKTYLKSQYDAGTPVIIYYMLATPTRLKFTDEQKAVAKELNNARTYKNVTNIYSTDETSPIIDLDYFTVTNETIKNEGNIQSRPILRLEKTVSEAVEITINDVRFKYNFSGDKYVDIDCENKTVEYEQLNRNRNLSIGYDFPKLNIGNNKIIMNDGDCILKVIRKDRWL